MGGTLCCIHRGSIPQRLHQQKSPAPARVIAADGLLKEIPASAHASVSDILGADSASFFLCNSDALYFNQSPPALSAGELLRSGQIYFVLPAVKLGLPLSSADMAALAVHASTALAAKKPPQGRLCRGGKKKVRVVPWHEELAEHDDQDFLFNEKLNERTLGDGEFEVTRIPAKRGEKLAAAVPARPKRKRSLSIIQEEDIAE